jgi:NAD(P)-dependent dehydrogenase (short-subunit alcohol dehydrogenase family)
MRDDKRQGEPLKRFVSSIHRIEWSNSYMDLGLKEKVVIVTGASKGIGRAIALAFGAERCHVVACARGQQELERLAEEIRAQGGSALAIAANVTNILDVERLVNETVAGFGTIHILVNNTGGIGSGGAFAELSDEEWLQVFDVNLFSAVKVTRAVLPYMQKQKWGRIINISSESGIQPDPTMPHYNASKAALINLSKSLSKAYARDGILVNTVSPAFVKTPLVEEMLALQAQARGIKAEEMERIFLRENRPHIELGRAGMPEEIAPAVVFLASVQASFINGENLRVDGGSVASI